MSVNELFSFSFKLNEKKKVVNNMVWREGYKKIFAGGGRVIFNMGVKKEDFTRKG